MTTVFLTWAMFLLLSAGPANSAHPSTCTPPPRFTVEVPCTPGEGCSEKWIFIDREPGGNA